VRVVLNTLGAEGYGIYNVVAGVVTMFGFLSGTMATASQRYFSFEIGRGDFERLKRIFSLSLLIYALVALIVLLLAETVGFWFINNRLIIPPERMRAARWIYQFSIISFVFTIVASPFMAAIIAREDMNIYAAVSIVEAALKLGIVFLLRIIPLDKLQLYGILLCAITVINTGLYRAICKLKYQECKFRFYWNRELFKELIGFTGWNLFGSAGSIAKNQMINILLNQFFSPLTVTARGIASSVCSAAMNLSNNFSMAIRPYIIKSYASGQKDVLSFVFLGTKIMFFLMYIFTLPLVLLLWLGSYPKYTIIFTQMALIDVLIDSVSYPITAVVQATGMVKWYLLFVTIIQLLNFPFSLLLLMFNMPAYSVMIVMIVITSAMLLARIIILKKIINYSVKQFAKIVIIPLFIVTILSTMIPVTIHNILAQGVLRLFAVTLVSIMSISAAMFFIGLNRNEREKTLNTASLFIKIFFNKEHKREL
jgi:O-antigen/teichoic acid export membrane protein